MKLKVYKVENNPQNENVIMLHGYGANGQDLVGLSQYPSLRKLDLNWYFLEAPLSPPELAMFGGRAWFSLTLSSFSPNMNKDALEKFYSLDNAEIKSSIEQANECIWDLNLQGTTYIGGFSQGAMMAANLFMNNSESYQGLIALSGAPLGFKNWNEMQSLKHAFVSHGEQDPVLPFKCGTDLSQELKNKKLEVTQKWFQGGHEIPTEILDELSKHLSKQL
jgi:phospholipase/carboxylesterase